MKIIAYSLTDLAGSKIAEMLRESYGFKKTGDEYEGTPVWEKNDVLLVGSRTYLTDVDSLGGYEPEVLIIASRHRAESGTPTLTCHVTGNFGPRADVGGQPGRLSIAPALYLRQALKGLQDNAGDLAYEVSLEVTHHGPTELSFPLLFVEVGSTPRQWEDTDALNTVARVVNDLAMKEPEKMETAIGFGGPHYAPNFTPAMENIALGHICPKHMMEYADLEMIRRMIEKTVPTPETIVMDWKGLRGTEKKLVTEAANELGIGLKRTSELK